MGGASCLSFQSFMTVLSSMNCRYPLRHRCAKVSFQPYFLMQRLTRGVVDDSHHFSTTSSRESRLEDPAAGAQECPTSVAMVACSLSIVAASLSQWRQPLALLGNFDAQPIRQNIGYSCEVGRVGLLAERACVGSCWLGRACHCLITGAIILNNADSPRDHGAPSQR